MKQTSLELDMSLLLVKKNGVKKLIYTSSPSVTFDCHDQKGVDESEPYPKYWLAHYPHTKALAEQMVLQANQSNGLLTCALRPHLIWGPGDRHLIPRLIERAKFGKMRRVGDGKNMVDVTYVKNAAIAHLQAAEALTSKSRVQGKAYFISQDEPVNCWDWVDELLRLFDRPPIKKTLSFRAAWQMGTALEWWYKTFQLKNEPVMTRFLAAQLSHSHWFDISAARNDFGYKPIVSIEEGMERLKKTKATP